MPLYESTFIARPDISPQQVDGLAEQFREILTEAGGEVAKTEYWGLRSLAYRIKKNRKGHYVLLNIDASADAVLEMERNMRINEDVIRYLTVKVEELESEPSIILRSKGSRDDRGRGPRRGPPGRGRDFDDRGPRGREGGRDGDRGAPKAAEGEAPAEAAKSEGDE